MELFDKPEDAKQEITRPVLRCRLTDSLWLGRAGWESLIADTGAESPHREYKSEKEKKLIEKNICIYLYYYSN